MNKFFAVNVMSLVLVGAFFTGIANANEALDAVNAAVEKKAQQLDQVYGVLLTTQERNNLKIALVAKAVLSATSTDETTTAEASAAAAYSTYEITDPTDQRNLLIEIQIVVGGGDDDPQVKPN